MHKCNEYDTTEKLVSYLAVKSVGMSSCRNCESVLGEGVAYCSACGQAAHLHRLNGHFLVHEGIHYMTHADKGVFHLIRDLAVKRGLVAKEYIEGKRRKYFSPFSFFMIIAAILVFGSTLGEREQTTDFSAHPDIVKITDGNERILMTKVYERREKSSRFTNQYANLMAMASLPLTALIFWLFFWRKGYNYVEHLVAGMYMLGFCLLVYALLILPLFYLMDWPRHFAALVFMAFHLIYFAIFYNGFVRNKTLGNQLRSWLASFLMIVVWSTLTFFTIRIYVTNGFWGILS